MEEESFYSKPIGVAQPLSRAWESFSKIQPGVNSKTELQASALEASDNTLAYQSLIREDARNTWEGLAPLTFPP